MTQDEDERQDLWVRYLQTGDDNLETLSAHLAEIRKIFSEDQLLQVTLWKQASTLSELALLELFEQFTGFEQSIMRLLAIGATLQEISGITGIGLARLRQAISIIRENEIWKV